MYNLKKYVYFIIFQILFIVEGDSKLLSGFPSSIIFQIGESKIKLLTEYENVTQRVLLPIDSMLQNAKQL
jgi:hypothetical protein